MDSSRPSILTIPTEILTDILSIVVPSLWPPGLGREFNVTTKLNQSPFHTLRSTCRTFRWIVDDLPFWKGNNFDIGCIDKYYYDGARPFNFQMYSDSTHYLEVLLSDPHLQQCLGRKTRWCLNFVNVFWILARTIPHFGQSVRHLHLSNEYFYARHSWDDIPQMLRASFPILTELKITTDSTTHVHLDIFPLSLQKLVYDAPLSSTCKCTNNLPNLESLCFYRIWSESPPFDLKRMLPFNSKTTLRELQFVPSENAPSDDELRDLSLLHQFENLTALRLVGGCVPMAQYQSLLQSPFRLTTFESQTSTRDFAHIETLVNLLRSPVLQNLQCLSISAIGRFHIERRPLYRPLISAITDHPVLETLQLLYFPVHIDWIDDFRNSRCLTSVEWKYRGLRPFERAGTYKACVLEEALTKVLSRSQGQVPKVKFLDIDPPYTRTDFILPGGDSDHESDDESDDE
jgi:hypothetical protein